MNDGAVAAAAPIIKPSTLLLCFDSCQLFHLSSTGLSTHFVNFIHLFSLLLWQRFFRLLVYLSYDIFVNVCVCVLWARCDALINDRKVGNIFFHYCCCSFSLVSVVVDFSGSSSSSSSSVAAYHRNFVVIEQ